jgi:hypothetical protein
MKFLSDPAAVAAIIASISALLGALIGSLVAFFVSVQHAKAEERKSFRESIMRTAIEYWQKHHEMVLSHSGGKPVEIVPIDSYLIHVATISKALFESDLSEKSILEALNKAQKMATLAEIHVRESQKI